MLMYSLQGPYLTFDLWPHENLVVTPTHMLVLFASRLIDGACAAMVFLLLIAVPCLFCSLRSQSLSQELRGSDTMLSYRCLIEEGMNPAKNVLNFM